jgi:hypothetical protein
VSAAAPNRDGGDDTRATRATDKKKTATEKKNVFRATADRYTDIIVFKKGKQNGLSDGQRQN